MTSPISMTDERVDELMKMQQLVAELIRSKEMTAEEAKIKRLMHMTYVEMVQLENNHEHRTAGTLLAGAQRMMQQAESMKNRLLRNELHSLMRELLPTLDVGRIKRIFTSILMDGMHEEAKFVILMCVAQLPPNPGRDALFMSLVHINWDDIDPRGLMIMVAAWQ